MMSIRRHALFSFAIATFMVALGGAAQAQQSIRIGASLSQTGGFAALG